MNHLLDAPSLLAHLQWYHIPLHLIIGCILLDIITQFHNFGAECSIIVSKMGYTIQLYSKKAQ